MSDPLEEYLRSKSAVPIGTTGADPLETYLNSKKIPKQEGPFSQLANRPEFNAGPPSTIGPDEESHFFPRSLSEAGQDAKNVGLSIYHGARRANDFATNLITHPIDTVTQIGANPGASYRQVMRGVNANIPFANRAVEAIGGPPVESPEDIAATPRGLEDFAGMAAAPGIGKIAGGIVSKGIEAGGNAVTAAGARAVKEAAKPPGTSSIFKAAQRAGAAGGASVGYKMAGAPGAIGGGYVGKQAGETVGRFGDKLAAALAKRHIARTAIPSILETPEAIPVPDNPQLVPLPEELAAQASANAPTAVRLSPLAHEGPSLPGAVPEGAFPVRPPHLDEITGEPVTQVGQGGFSPNEAPTNVDGKVPPRASLKSAIIRDVKRFGDVGSDPGTKTPPWDTAEVPEPPVASQLEQSVRMLSDLKAAAKAGKASAEMIREAINAGMPPQLVSNAVGRIAFENARSSR